jgi:hypothetical protein
MCCFLQTVMSNMYIFFMSEKWHTCRIHLCLSRTYYITNIGEDPLYDLAPNVGKYAVIFLASLLTLTRWTSTLIEKINKPKPMVLMIEWFQINEMIHYLNSYYFNEMNCWLLHITAANEVRGWGVKTQLKVDWAAEALQWGRTAWQKWPNFIFLWLLWNLGVSNV